MKRWTERRNTEFKHEEMLTMFKGLIDWSAFQLWLISKAQVRGHHLQTAAERSHRVHQLFRPVSVTLWHRIIDPWSVTDLPAASSLSSESIFKCVKKKLKPLFLWWWRVRICCQATARWPIRSPDRWVPRDCREPSSSPSLRQSILGNRVHLVDSPWQ